VPKHPVTPPARDAFLLYVRHWQERLGLLDWRIVVSAKPAAKAHMAEVASMDLAARLASLRLGADFGSVPVGDASLEELALHEVLHVFLHELIECCRDDDVPADVVASVEHRVIHLLCRLLAGGSSE